MKTAILALCLAALATSAEARNWAGYHCPQGDIQMLAAKYFTPGMASGQCTRPCDSNFHYFKDGDDPEKSRRSTALSAGAAVICFTRARNASRWQKANMTAAHQRTTNRRRPTRRFIATPRKALNAGIRMAHTDPAAGIKNEMAHALCNARARHAGHVGHSAALCAGGCAACRVFW
jgi:hypothetical protein